MEDIPNKTICLQFLKIEKIVILVITPRETQRGRLPRGKPCHMKSHAGSRGDVIQHEIRREEILPYRFWFSPAYRWFNRPNFLNFIFFKSQNNKLRKPNNVYLQHFPPNYEKSKFFLLLPQCLIRGEGAWQTAFWSPPLTGTIIHHRVAIVSKNLPKATYLKPFGVEGI